MLSSFAAHLVSTVLLGASPAPMADIFVDVANASCAAGTGSAASPVCSISAAISLAAPGDTIRIAPGTYLENVAIGFDLDLIGTSGASVTVVDGGAAGSVVTIPTAVTVAIDGLTLRNGVALEGGGISVEGNLTLSNSTITANLATGYGGGGLGSASGFGTVTITNSTITGNTASNYYGGGVFVSTGALIISDSTISENTAYSYGGGIAVIDGTLTVTDSTISENTAYSYGGGIAVVDGTLTVADSTIRGNQVPSGYGGGLEVFGAGHMMLRGSTISGNTASGAGGGFEALDGSFDVENCTISGNSAGYGGGISSLTSLLGNALSNVTITDNTAADYGGGLYGLGNVTEVRNSIIAGNIVIDTYYLATADVAGGNNSLGYNLVGIGGGGFVNGVNGNLVGTLAMPIDPLLGPLGDNGGPTLTHEPALMSPALDTGDPVTFAATDQRGNSRPQGPAPDIGSVEVDGLSLGSFCNGDGGNQMGCTDCPCSNNTPPGTEGGCINSSGNGTHLSSSGSTSVSLPSGDTTDLRFGVSNAPANAFCILNSGDGVAPGNVANPCFGLGTGGQALAFDGLRCAIMNTRRHGGRSADANGEVGVTNNPWGGEGGPPVGIANAGAGFLVGQTRYFQVINRDDPLAVCMRGLNTSQGLRATFTP